LLCHLMTSEKNCFDQLPFRKVLLIESGSWRNRHNMSDSIPWKESSFLVTTIHVEQFEVEFFKLVVFETLLIRLKNLSS